MKKRQRSFKGFCSVLVMLYLVLMTLTPVFAEDAGSANQSVKDVRNGIVHINLTYSPKDGGAKRVLQSGTGFIIGTDEKAVTVLTNNHVVTMTSEYRSRIESYFEGISIDEDVKIEVVVKGDVTINAKVVKASADVDFAILEMEQAIGGKTPLTIAAQAEMEDIVTQPVYALGYPVYMDFGTDYSQYSQQDITITNGTVNKQVNSGMGLLIHSADLSSGNSGGPLVNSNGTVVGVNTGGYADTNYYVAVNIRDISSILDMLGYAYNSTDGVITPNATTDNATGEIDKSKLEAAIKSAKEVDTTKYTDETVTTFTGALEDAQKVFDNAEAKQEQINNATTELTNATSGLAEKQGVNWALYGGIGAAVVVVIVVVIIIMSSSKKKKAKASKAKADRGRAEANPNVEKFNANTSSSDVMTEGSDGTSVLDDGAGNTTVIGNQSMPYAILQRKSPNESIQINKAVFAIGKERRKVDYCVSDNSSVSRIHVIINYREGAFYLKDQNATNGTFINGNRVSSGQEVKLENGDKVTLSNVEFEFKG